MMKLGAAGSSMQTEVKSCNDPDRKVRMTIHLNGLQASLRSKANMRHSLQTVQENIPVQIFDSDSDE